MTIETQESLIAAKYIDLRQPKVADDVSPRMHEIIASYEEAWQSGQEVLNEQHNSISGVFEDLSFLPGDRNLIRDYLTAGEEVKGSSQVSLFDAGGVALVVLENEWRVVRFNFNKNVGKVTAQLLVAEENNKLTTFMNITQDVAEDNLLAIVETISNNQQIFN